MRLALGTVEAICASCNENKPISSFRCYTTAGIKSGALLYSNDCRACRCESARTWWHSKHPKVGPARGLQHYEAKRTWFEIRMLRSNLKIPVRAMGRLLGVNSGHVSRIRRGLMWKTQN